MATLPIDNQRAFLSIKEIDTVYPSLSWSQFYYEKCMFIKILKNWKPNTIFEVLIAVSKIFPFTALRVELIYFDFISKYLGLTVFNFVILFLALVDRRQGGMPIILLLWVLTAWGSAFNMVILFGTPKLRKAALSLIGTQFTIDRLENGIPGVIQLFRLTLPILITFALKESTKLLDFIQNNLEGEALIKKSTEYPNGYIESEQTFNEGLYWLGKKPIGVLDRLREDLYFKSFISIFF